MSYELVLSPRSPIVSVGATTHLELRPTRYDAAVVGFTETVHWTGYHVETTWDGDEGETSRPSTTTTKLPGPIQGTVSRAVTWPKAGTWHVTARVERTGKVYHCEQVVVARKDVIARSKVWPETFTDPHHAAEWGRHALEAMAEVATSRRKMTPATAKRHAAQTLELRKYVEGLERLLVGAPHQGLSFIRGAWVADVVDDVAEDVIEVRVVLYKVDDPFGGPKWQLVDWTNPTCSEALAVHEGRAMDDAASIELAIKRWHGRNQYPKGRIKYEVDGMAGYLLVKAHDDPNARLATVATVDDFALLLSEILGWVSMGTFVLGLAALATGVGAVTAPALLAVSAATGATSGGTHMVYLINVGSESWRAYAFDALSIAGNMLGLRGGAFKLLGTTPIKIGAAKTTRMFVLGEITTSGIELVLVLESTHDQLEKIGNNPKLTPREKLERATKLIGVAVGTSALLLWSAHQSAVELQNIKRFLKSSVDPDPSWRGHIEGNKDAAEQLDMKVHSGKRIPDQAMLFADVLEARVGAKHAADVANGSATKVPKRLQGWTEGLHWSAASSKRPGAAGTLQLPDGTIVPGRSVPKTKARLDAKIKKAGKDSAAHYPHFRHAEVREAYAAVGIGERGRNHGGCAEGYFLDDALDLVNPDQLRGSVSDVRFVRRTGVKEHGIAVPACESCQQVLRRFGVIDVNSVRRNQRRVSSRAVRDYLKRLGFPGDWSRAPEAIALLEAKGFPVSPLTQEFIRRFGGLDAQANLPPPGPGTADVQHAPAPFYIDPFEVADDGEVVGEMESEMGLAGLCPVGFDTTGSGVMCLDARGTIWFQDCGWGYSGATVDEALFRLLEGRPDLTW